MEVVGFCLVLNNDDDDDDGDDDDDLSENRTGKRKVWGGLRSGANGVIAAKGPAMKEIRTYDYECVFRECCDSESKAGQDHSNFRT
mmetsp:Transcript_55904/g.122200  ORF Transcript_55904/g.122200 Transcript_55904/m.122200 type:complete len:86 (+) Transcript_55904:59-316(+)